MYEIECEAKTGECGGRCKDAYISGGGGRVSHILISPSASTRTGRCICTVLGCGSGAFGCSE